MKWIGVAPILAGLLWGGGSRAGEAPAAPQRPLPERPLRRAEMLFEHGDLAAALKLYLRVTREAKDEEQRNEAREHLTWLGLSTKEIFKLDPAKAPAAQMEKVYAKLAAFQRRNHRLEVEGQYMHRLFMLAVYPRMTSAGKVQVDIDRALLLKGLALAIELALEEKGGEIVRRAQRMLERMSISGLQVEEVRKQLEEKKLPDTRVNRALAGACFLRLQEYREEAGGGREGEEEEEGGGEEEEDGEAGREIRKRMSKKLGIGLLKFLEKNHAKAPILKSQNSTIDYWRQEAKGGAGTEERF